MLSGTYQTTCACPALSPHDACQVRQAPVIYDVFYRDGSATAHRDIWWESDGAPLTEEEVLLSVAAYAQSRLYFEWECPGDAILLDNHRMAHGRMPYRGKRKVAVLTGNTD